MSTASMATTDLSRMIKIGYFATSQSMNMFMKRPSKSTVSKEGIIVFHSGRLGLGKSCCHASVGLQMIAAR